MGERGAECQGEVTSSLAPAHTRRHAKPAHVARCDRRLSREGKGEERDEALSNEDTQEPGTVSLRSGVW